MPKAQILWGFFAAVLVASLGLASTGAFTYLWVFPLDADVLALWMLLCGLDIALARSGFQNAGGARALLWCSGLLFFTARQNVPEVGLTLIVGSALLWALARNPRNLVPVAAGVAFALFLFGHDTRTVHSGMVARLVNLRFSFQLLSAFTLFRMISWSVAVTARRERPGFLATMEYFLAPAFWLSPMHAAHLVFDRMQSPQEPVPALRCAGWIARGFLHALFFTWLSALLVPRLTERYQAGLSSFYWWELLLLGPALFVLAYLEKSRVSYLVAGNLALTGRDVEPDFRAPWAARSLPEYWRRFHFWVWEYYVDLFYMPLSSLLRRRLSVRSSSLAALFFTFSIGTSLIHWVHYPAPYHISFLLGCLFGFVTLLHGLAGGALENPKIGIPVTWLSVFLLYAVAYPVYGLGWDLPMLFSFFRR